MNTSNLSLSEAQAQISALIETMFKRVDKLKSERRSLSSDYSIKNTKASLALVIETLNLLLQIETLSHKWKVQLRYAKCNRVEIAICNKLIKQYTLRLKEYEI